MLNLKPGFEDHNIRVWFFSEISDTLEADAAIQGLVLFCFFLVYNIPDNGKT